jgi:transposase
MDKAPAPTFVGIDVSKLRLDVHLRPSGERFVTDHDDEGVAALVGRLAALAPALIVLEATGGMEVRLAAALAAAGPPARRPAGRGRQPAPGARLRPRHRSAGEDRPPGR